MDNGKVETKGARILREFKEFWDAETEGMTPAQRRFATLTLQAEAMVAHGLNMAEEKEPGFKAKLMSIYKQQEQLARELNYEI